MTTSLKTREPRTRLEWPALRHDARDLFDRLISDLGYPLGDQSVVLPSVDLVERDNVLEATTDVPGFKADQLDVEVHDNLLTIRGQIESESENKGERTVPFGTTSRELCKNAPAPMRRS